MRKRILLCASAGLVALLVFAPKAHEAQNQLTAPGESRAGTPLQSLNVRPGPGADAELLVFRFKPIKAGALAQLDITSLVLQSVAGGSVDHDRLSAFRASVIP